MVIRCHMSNGATIITAYSNNKKDKAVYGRFVIDESFERIPKDSLRAAIRDLQTASAENYVNKHTPQGYTFIQEAS